jgi:hypothetical protein
MRQADIKTHWAYRELVRKFEDQGKPHLPRKRGEPIPIEEQGTLFLFDPAVRAELDETITELMWPQVLRGLEDTYIRIYGEDAILAAIKDKCWPEATRQLTFLLEDPARPIVAGQKTIWYVRGNIRCSLLSYMISFDLILYLPMEVNLGRIILLMSDEHLVIPPTLSIDGDSYSLTFSWGKGGGHWNKDVAPERLITDSIRKHLKIIEIADQLESSPADPRLFDNLTTTILAMYGAE